MKKPKYFSMLLIGLGLLFALPVFSQVHCDLLQANNAAGAARSYNSGYLFGIMELPFLFIAVFFAFMTAGSLKGGRFGKGMQYMAWGFLVMAIGHLHMQIEHNYGYNILQSLLGQTNGQVAWFVALMLTWGLSGMGFYSIYKASKGA
jgi:hypothetical protein